MNHEFLKACHEGIDRAAAENPNAFSAQSMARIDPAKIADFFSKLLPILIQLLSLFPGENQGQGG